MRGLNILKSNFKDLPSLSNKAVRLLSLLGFALKEKSLSSEVYFKWAMAHYNLPKLRSSFFTETPVSQEMFAKWATHYPWSMECLPVAEWDGSLIVACLQPPQDFPSNPASILILAELADLQKAWASLHPEHALKVSLRPAIPAAVPEGLDLSLNTQNKKSSDSFSFEDLVADAGESSSLGEGFFRF